MATAFKFVVPDAVEPGVILKLVAPDGVELHIPLPQQAQAGDEIHMHKEPDGKWAFLKILRGAAPDVGQRPATRSEADMADDLRGPDVVAINIETTKGPLLMQIVPSWSPLGANRFLQLVDDGFFKDVAIYRGVEGFLLQFGVVADPDRTQKYDRIPDDPLLGVPYLEGMVGFAAAGPGTRNHTLCFFLGAMPSLGGLTTETPIGKILPRCLETLHKLHCPGDIPQCGGQGPDPARLAEEGNRYVAENFPECDYLIGCSRVGEPV